MAERGSEQGMQLQSKPDGKLTVENEEPPFFTINQPTNHAPPIYSYDQPSDAQRFGHQLYAPAQVVTSQPTAQPTGIPGEVNNYDNTMVSSVLVCFFCNVCPFGIMAIFFTVLANHSLAKGNLEEARKSALVAKVLVVVALFCGTATIVYLAFFYNYGRY